MSLAVDEASRNLNSLVDGFEVLQQEYQRLWYKSQTLERNLKTATEQYKRVAHDTNQHEEVHSVDLAHLELDDLEAAGGRGKNNDEWLAELGRCNGGRVSAAKSASNYIRAHMLSSDSNNVQIHTGPTADKPVKTTSSAMPSIYESPLELDFTTTGTPSKLGCPFASMENRRLSSHAASVVSKYRPNGAVTPRSSVSRINGRTSSVANTSLNGAAEPIETCAMQSPSKRTIDVESAAGSTGVCPIRFLDDRSPEDVAAYFEEHKHELPRSHEMCVMKYQSNEDSIKQLDAKYGNLVSMIQGLGMKHAPMLPEKIDDEGEDGSEYDAQSNERVRRWARTISGDEDETKPTVEEDERLPHFDRPMKDIRIGESPSRPWGIQVPLSAEDRDSDVSSMAAAAPVADTPPGADRRTAQRRDLDGQKPVGKCPFGFDADQKPGKAAQPKVNAAPKITNQPIFVNPEPDRGGKASALSGGAPSPMVFNGPVFIGYSVEQALALVQGIKANVD